MAAVGEKKKKIKNPSYYKFSEYKREHLDFS